MSTAITPAPRARRMDISELPDSAQHFRNNLFPSAQPLVSNGKVTWVPTVFTSGGGMHVLWSDRELASDDRDEALSIACYSCDRFVVAAYLESLGQISISPKP